MCVYTHTYVCKVYKCIKTERESCSSHYGQWNGKERNVLKNKWYDVFKSYDFFLSESPYARL